MKTFYKNWLRHLIQWGTLIVISLFLLKVFSKEAADPEAYCPFGGLETLATFFVSGSLACSMTMSQIMMGIVLGVGVILFSKLFCGYLCPLGWGGEQLLNLRKKLKIKEISIKDRSVVDIIFRSLKYILLFLTFYYTISSSELFCKNYDPYYAVATGFKGEITLWMAIVALALFVIGNFFIKMFWCKYLCPLGALSNIFKYAISFVILVLLFLVINIWAIKISWIYLLAAVSITGLVLELVYMKSKIFPVLKISRDQDKCTKCNLCNKYCPYGIDVANSNKVDHIDCNLCMECVSVCKDDALKINKKSYLRWAPAILVVIMFFTAIYLGSKFELPTIDEKWGENLNQLNLKSLKVEGLKSVKCYGSSKAFSAQLQKIEGVYGVSTFVKHHNVSILYNPDKITPDKIKELIYIPVKFKISTPPQDLDSLVVITIRTEKMYDKLDATYLGMQFRATEKGYYGLETEYACPLIVRLYINKNEPIDKDFLEKIVELESVQIPSANDEFKTIELEYEFISLDEKVDKISRLDFLKRQLFQFSKSFETNSEKWSGKDEKILEIIYPNLDKPAITRYIPYLSSFLSLQDGILGLETAVSDKGEYLFKIKYSAKAITENKIFEVLKMPEWQVKTKDGEIQIIESKIPF